MNRSETCRGLGEPSGRLPRPRLTPNVVLERTQVRRGGSLIEMLITLVRFCVGTRKKKPASPWLYVPTCPKVTNCRVTELLTYSASQARP